MKKQNLYQQINVEKLKDRIKECIENTPLRVKGNSIQLLIIQELHNTM
jgi:hypothetical protein